MPLSCNPQNTPPNALSDVWLVVLVKTPLSHSRYLYDLGQTEQNSVSPSCLNRDLVADTWIKMIRGSKCTGWTKGKGSTEPKEKAQPRPGLRAPMNIKRANLRVDKESTAGVCSSVSRTEQITRADLMFPWPGCFLFLSSSLVSRCLCCCSRRAGVAFSILERNYARRGEEGGGGGKETARVQPECCASCLFLFPLSSNETSLKARSRKV